MQPRRFLNRSRRGFFYFRPTYLSDNTHIFAARARASQMPSSDDLLAAARKVAPDAAVFDENPPVFIRAEISNNSLDAYGTRMMKSTLKNYAKEAKRGVSLQNSHRTDELGIGYSFGGEFVEEG